jgi:hypothetical protein
MFLASSSFSENVRVSDNGIVNNLISLFSDIKITEVLGLMKQCLKNLVVQNSPHSSIYVDSQCKQESEMTMESIEEALQIVLVPSNDWSFKKLVRRLRATCFSRHRTVAAESSMSPEEIAAHFQVRVPSQS